MKKIYKSTLIFFGFILFSTFSKTIYAAEQIDKFEASIVINKDGTVDFQENIDYNFGINAVDRHGIIRNIPLGKTNQEGKKFLLSISNIEVPEYNYYRTIESDEATLKVGDPDILVTGVKNYKLRYKISGALAYFINKDELYWNVTGTEWDVPIGSAEAVIILPEEIEEEYISAYCYTGEYGDDNKKCEVEKNGSTVIFKTTDFLEASEGLTIAVGFPKGHVAELKPKEDKVPVIFLILTIIVGLVILSVGILWYIIAPIKLIIKATKIKNFHKTHEKIVAAWFEPPEYENGKAFLPAETSTIVSNKIDNKAITATIIHLAQKGFLKIHVKGQKDTSFEKLPEPKGAKISSQERDIYETLFKKGDTIELKKLSKDQTFYNAVVSFKKAIKQKLSDKGMYEKTLSQAKDSQMGMLVLSVITLNIPYMILRIILAKNLIKRTLIGIEKYSEAVSLKNFLVSQDEQLDYQAEQQLFFEKLLPYATAFGVEDVWIKKFNHLNFDTSEWYDGNITDTMALTRMTKNINSTVNSSISYAAGTSSSSGFSSGSSGGGFSGGGGGGGGGSSW